MNQDGCIKLSSRHFSARPQIFRAHKPCNHDQCSRHQYYRNSCSNCLCDRIPYASLAAASATFS